MTAPSDRLLRVAVALALPLVLVLPLSWLGGAVWLAELVTPWRPHLGGLLGLLGLLVVRRDRRLAAGLVLLGSAHVVVAVARLLPRTARPGVHTLDVALLNVHARNPEHAALRAWVDGTGADVVVLVEVTPGLVHALEGAYPHAVVVPHDDDEFGVGVWSRFPLGQVVEERPHGYVSTVQLTVDADGAPLRLGVLHAPPPLSPGLVSERADVLAGVAGGLRAHGGPSVLLGDLNLTPWSPHLRHLRVVARLEDGAAGFGPAPTWPAFAGPLGIPIDHVLVSPEVAVLGYTTATAPGSDHRAVLARLSW